MKSHTTVLLVAALLLVAWSWSQPGARWVDLGDGLLMRADGSVLAAWELPDCAVAADMFDASGDAAVSIAATPEQAWRARLDRGW